MATLSRTTIGTAVQLLSLGNRTELEHFFYQNEVPDNLVVGSNRLAMVMNVFRALEAQGEHELIVQLIERALPDLHEQAQRELQQCLLRDGVVVDGGAVIDAEPEAEEQRSAITALLSIYETDFDSATLSHHLSECEDLFRQEKWDSSIAHCRNFVERLLTDVATALAAARKDQPDLSQPRLVRDYLQSVKFIDGSERRKLVDGVYGYFSEEGSHPGISTHSAARVSKSFLLSFAFYILEKYGAWKSGEFQLP